MEIAKQLVALWAIVFLAGCSSITPGAGKAHYTMTYTDSKGGVYVIDLLNTKNIGQLDAGVTVGSVTVWLKEEGVDAAGPMAQMAEANAKIIETFLNATKP
jgi:hypothetical protein